MSKFAAVFGEGAGGIGDRVFGETEQAEAMGELRLLMPDFSIEEFLREDISETIAPAVLSAYLKGDVEGLRRTCRDAAFGVLQRSVMEREAQQLLMDPRILHISDPELEGIRFIGGTPTPVVSFEAHQLNCVRSKQTAAVVEGSEDDIRAVYYLLALQPVEASEAEEADAGGADADAPEGGEAGAGEEGGAKGATPDEAEPLRWQVTELAVRGMQSVY
jgi:import inner membrane translocase subunit TIM44